jgi:hypothetical protein
MKFDNCPERENVMRRGWAPLAYRQFMRRVGGLNPYGENYYRLVLAESIFEWHGGHWIDWPENATLQEMGGLVFAESDKLEIRKHVVQLVEKHIPQQEIEAEVIRLVPSLQQPLRAVDEMRFVRRYPYHRGWMLQCWRPPEQFGSKTWWESQTVPGRPDLPILGPFPTKGDYEAIDHLELGPNGIEITRTTWSELPSLSGLEEGIHFLEDQKYREREGASPEARILIRTHDYERAIAAHNEKVVAERNLAIGEALKPYLGNSLAAGRLRTEAAEEAGIKHHVGN